MIAKTKQNWTPGQTVKVGFLSLEVVEYDSGYAAYRLWNPKSEQEYTFTPHLGLQKGW